MQKEKKQGNFYRIFLISITKKITFTLFFWKNSVIIPP